MNLSTPLARAQLALTGLAIGDAIGGFFEFSQGKLSHHITSRTLPNGIWHWTDDTQMALSVFVVLRRYSKIDQDFLAASLAQHYERSRGYGMSTRAVLKHIRQGETWQAASDAVFGGEGSFGNGGASRVPPLGAFFADDLSQVIEQATHSAVVTHSHPESIAGTIAVAVATALVWRLRPDKEISRKMFLEQVNAYVPKSEVHEKLIAACELDEGISVQEAASILGNGSKATAQTTVPFAIWCASDFRQSFSDAIWRALEGQGDCDTICAIVGGITAVRVGFSDLPADWRKSCEPLPIWIFDDLYSLSLSESLGQLEHLPDDLEKSDRNPS
jgi:ADP-ribosylglycohydrolase